MTGYITGYEKSHNCSCDKVNPRWQVDCIVTGLLPISLQAHDLRGLFTTSAYLVSTHCIILIGKLPCTNITKFQISKYNYVACNLNIHLGTIVILRKNEFNHKSKVTWAPCDNSTVYSTACSDVHERKYQGPVTSSWRHHEWRASKRIVIAYEHTD